MSHFGTSHSVLNFFILIFVIYKSCHDDLWSLIGGVTIVIILGHHKPCPCKTANFRDVMCVLTAPQLAVPTSLFFSLGPLFPETNSIEIRPINNPLMASERSSGRKSYTSHFKSKARDD